MGSQRSSKEPEVLEWCRDGTYRVSLKWIGYVLLTNNGWQPDGLAEDINSILGLATLLVRKNYRHLIPEGEDVAISKDGRAMVMFVEKDFWKRFHEEV